MYDEKDNFSNKICGLNTSGPQIIQTVAKPFVADNFAHVSSGQTNYFYLYIKSSSNWEGKFIFETYLLQIDEVDKLFGRSR